MKANDILKYEATGATDLTGRIVTKILIQPENVAATVSLYDDTGVGADNLKFQATVAAGTAQQFFLDYKFRTAGYLVLNNGSPKVFISYQ
jgi:hypothetical protein